MSTVPENGTPIVRFRGPSDSIDIKRLERETKKLFFLGFLVAILVNAAAGAVFMFLKTEVRITRPPMIEFIAVKPKLTRPMIIDRRYAGARVLQRKLLSYRKPFIQVQPRQLPSPELQYIHFEPKFDLEIVTPPSSPFYESIGEKRTSREPEKHISMREEMISLEDLDTGQYKAMVVQDPDSKQHIKGFVYIPTVWGEQLRPPDNLKRAFLNLVEAINRYTDIKAQSDPHLFLDSRKLFDLPFIYITTDRAFELTKIEQRNFSAYLRKGGFALIDNGTPQYEFGQAEASLRQMLRDSLGADARFLPIPVSHPLYHCLFDFNDGPPLGGEIRWADTSTTGLQGIPARAAYMTKPVNYLEGIWLGSRLVAIYSDKGYASKWNEYTNNEPQLKMGVNIVVFALTQRGGIAQQRMDTFTTIR